MKNILSFILILFVHISLIGCSSDSSYTLNQKIINEINKYRLENGLKELTYDVRADSSAKYHSTYLAKLGMVCHLEDIEIDGSNLLHDIDDRMAKYGVTKYWVIGENVAGVFDTSNLCIDTLVHKVIQGWKDSPGHNKIMLNKDITKIGVNYTQGTHKSYFYEDIESGDILLGRDEINSWLFVMNVFTEK